MPTPVRGVNFQPTVPPPYSSLEEIQSDITAISRDEMVALAEEGVTYIQFDKVINQYISEASRQRLKSQGIDPDAAFAAEIAIENSCYDAIRRDGMTLAMHFCRGNRVGWTGGSGAYDAIAEQAFKNLHVDRFLLEYDTHRAGGFEPLRFVPKETFVHLGLVSTKSAQLESQDDLLRRIEEASQYISIDQLGIGPQCGFQSASERDGPSMTIDDQRRKLELIVNTAQNIWS